MFYELNWIVFVVWLETAERRLALFPAGTITREPEFRLSWMKLCISDKHYTNSNFFPFFPILIYFLFFFQFQYKKKIGFYTLSLRFFYFNFIPRIPTEIPRISTPIPLIPTLISRILTLTPRIPTHILHIPTSILFPAFPPPFPSFSSFCSPIPHSCFYR